MDTFLNNYIERTKKYFFRMRWIYFFIGLFAGIFINSVSNMCIQDFLQSLIPEFVGITFTVLFIDKLSKDREKINLRNDLIFKMGGQVNYDVLRAVEQLKKYKWLFDGALHHANLAHANIQNARLALANLEEADFYHASLNNADLYNANLTNSNMKAARLNGATLELAEIQGAKFNEDTILPDNTNWTPDTDMERFTNRDHNEFWRSKDKNSPAFRDF